ncbi:MAG: glycosyl transferase group 1 [Gammaproteobacteria bacterium]|nr:glycosyl transferase group 1 [Gammaproteobacteria bacterium]MBM2829555.1 glycosyl transferase group 1 [Gammaproteobacteria bacterium]
MKVISPVPTGSGAFIAHKSLELGIKDYKVIPYNPYWALVPPVISCFNDKSADIIHAPVDYAIFSRLGRKPLISTFHGFVLDQYMQKYVTLLHRIHYCTDLRWFTLAALDKSRVVTCVSQYLAHLVREELGYKGEIRVIYNGIDINKFSPDKTTEDEKKEIKVLYCGGGSRRKGADLIQPILDRLYKNITLIHTSGLKSGKRQGMNTRTVFSRRVKHEAMPSLYNEVDMLLFPTVREGFGLAVAEAMACGLPVIATNCSAMPELIDDNKGGFLCEIGNVDMFAEKINLLARSHSLRREMGAYNRQKAEQKFTLDRMTREYKLLFEEVLS